MTKRLYQEDSHLLCCEATVERCEPTDDGYDVTLDRTVIFDNAGGQPCDTGRIGEAVVSGCDERDGALWHHVDRAFAPGERVTVTLDWARRFDHMQQHTGEHLLSHALYTLFGANNIGFHLASSYTTVDLDRALTPEQLTEAEHLANQYVSRDLAVTARCYDSEEALAGLPLRKQAEGLRAPIRIVQVEDADCCTCCAPHCRHTGEVGGILITDAMPYKSGMRLTFLCGLRALAYAERLHADMDRLARRFSTGRENVVATVSKLQDDHTRLRRRERELIAQLNGYLARDLVAAAQQAGQATLIVAQLPDLPPERLKSLAQQTLRAPRTLCVLFSYCAERLGYVLCSTADLGLDMGELCQVVNMATGGKGGGRGTLAQGTALSDSGLAETVEQLRGYFRQRLSQR